MRVAMAARLGVAGRAGLALALVAAGGLALGIAGAPSAVAQPAQDRLVSEIPASFTPNISDGRVLSIAQVGSKVIMGGTFTKVVKGATTFTRNSIVAINATTGAVDTAFAPTINGTVETVLAGPNNTVYVGGTFSTVNGTNTRNLAKLSTATGAKVSGYTSLPVNGAVQDLELLGNRLYVAGTFTTYNAVPHGGLAALDATTGAVDEFMGIDVTEHHNFNGSGANAPVGANKLSLSPDGSRLVAIGNFRKADGLSRDQVAQILLGGATAAVDPNWQTLRFVPACARNAFDSYVRDVDFSPDGSYFAIVTTGGPNPGTLCDTATRWNVADTGQAVEPKWINDTGGDTLFSVAVTGPAIYVGGHQRWLNNAGGRDRAVAGAVARPGLGALDPANGVPFSWNPGRQPRGVGAFALYATPAGLWVGMDTDYFGNFEHFRGKVGFFPLEGGKVVPVPTTPTLPGNVHIAGPQSAGGFFGGTPAAGGANDVVRRAYDPGVGVGAQSSLIGTGTWSNARGSFMVDGTLFFGQSDGKLYKRSYDGAVFGPATLVDPYHDPKWDSVDTGSGQTYAGVTSSFYGSVIQSLGSMLFANGRIYFTRTGFGQPQGLYARGFTPESGIIDPTQITVAASGWSDAGGMFLSDNMLYVVRISDGSLVRTPWNNGVPTLSGATVVSGPSRDGKNWKGRAIFLAPPPAVNQPPTAAFTSSCLGLTCTFDGTSSSDSDGTVASYAWNFGDGGTATGATPPPHPYAAGGPYTVTLTVTDDDLATGSVQHVVTVTPPGQGIVFRGAATPVNKSTNSVSLTVPANVQAGDGLVLSLSLTTTTTTIGQPTGGFVSAGTQANGTAMVTTAWQKVATATDAGSTVTIALSASVKVNAHLLAYSGTSAAGPVASFAGSIDSSTATHVTPAVAVGTDGSWVVSFWADKSSTTTAWTLPAGQVLRSSAIGTGTGYNTAVISDGNAGSSAGPAGGLTATTNAASTKAVMLTVVLAPA